MEGGASSPLLSSRLHDFGFRGCTCVEQSVLGGVAHLLNFTGWLRESQLFGWGEMTGAGGNRGAAAMP